MHPVRNKHIIVGITGSIAAYKSFALMSFLMRAGAEVEVIMTPAAKHFITPLSVSAITRRKVHMDMFDTPREWEITHISLAKKADAVLIAPASAHTISCLAMGLAPNLLTSVCLATASPIIVAPAMNTGMYHNSAIQKNLRTIRERGIAVVCPGKGHLACGEEGEGRLADTEVILRTLADNITLSRELNGKTVLVSAGPTRENIDSVRYIANASSGIMGHALAEAARKKGARVVLLSSVLENPSHPEITRIPFNSVKDLKQALEGCLGTAHAYIAAAAVGDFTCEKPAFSKLSRSRNITIALKRTEDILLYCSGRFPSVLCAGFSLSDRMDISLARKKLAAKKCAIMIANQKRSIGSDRTRFAIICRNQKPVLYPEMSKTQAAEIIMDTIARKIRQS